MAKGIRVLPRSCHSCQDLAILARFLAFLAQELFTGQVNSHVIYLWSNASNSKTTPRPHVIWLSPNSPTRPLPSIHTQMRSNKTQEKVINVQPSWIFLFFLGRFLTKTHPNSVKSILELNVQGGNSVQSMLFYPGFVEQNPC